MHFNYCYILKRIVVNANAYHKILWDLLPQQWQARGAGTSRQLQIRLELTDRAIASLCDAHVRLTYNIKRTECLRNKRKCNVCLSLQPKESSEYFWNVRKKMQW
jgi:hypothetical protein